MLSAEKMARINELGRKKKSGTLTAAEEKEQILLRQEYLEAFRSGMRHHIEGMKVVDPEGNDVTPEKLKQIQKEKGLHDRK
ncbi:MULTISPECIES: DUF896 family protein [Enterococcus]|uniref:UPF0291 protein BAU18_001660 n=1 Tax=Enterococcus diestrammenae TaxID=1155073 RepID=A0ABV0F4S9_9ENTE|nr:DUF896 family protein [Enterococcus diestrammenae]KAF1295309.1 hypothetical protein BAU18_10945 [Enterococcus diestrammenae]HIX71170.1 DUF896 family protein [Candidatus Enterococcus stercoravium]